MATVNKSSLQNILQSVLSVAAEEMTFFYSPYIYSQHRNVIESMVLSALVKVFPANPTVIDQLAPFVRIAIIPVTNGFIQLPDGKDGKTDAYRNILGAPMIFARPDSTGECSSGEPLTPENFKAGILKSGCRLNPVEIVPQSEFAERTKSTYGRPDFENPIGYFAGANQIKVCPYDLTKVAVMYAKKERLLNYGYITQPDDTYLYDEETTVDTEFDSNAFDLIFNANMALYSAYAKDQALQNWSAILSEKGIL